MESTVLLAKHRRYYTPSEVALHNAMDDCWVSFFHRVYDLTPLLAKHGGLLAEPIVEAAGTDITSWFDEDTRDPKTHVDPKTGLVLPHTPHGRFIHVPPPEPVSSWRTDFGTPWWRDEETYCIGSLSERTRFVLCVNVMTGTENRLEVASEETMEEVLDRYLEYNSHASSYTWKALEEGEFRPLDMHLTLEENGVEDETEELKRLGMDPDEYIPVLHLCYDDDLTFG
eukprot:PLAT6998.1.p1 GENE.PLAT6998.1~~PLAT6998.1.p1  ORF type:complete len:235 (+),score=90.41 PLAT6998.1:26-706(+)